MLEVLVSLVILGITVATLLRSFTLSLEAARRSDTVNTATLLAQDLIEELQVSPPRQGHYQGDFGPEHSGFVYDLTVKEEEIDYKDVRRTREIKDFRPLKTVHLEVFHDDGRGERARMIRLDSAVMGLQKFSDLALKEYQLFELY